MSDTHTCFESEGLSPIIVKIIGESILAYIERWLVSRSKSARMGLLGIHRLLEDIDAPDESEYDCVISYRTRMCMSYTCRTWYQMFRPIDDANCPIVENGPNSCQVVIPNNIAYLLVKYGHIGMVKSICARANTECYCPSGTQSADVSTIPPTLADTIEDRLTFRYSISLDIRITIDECWSIVRTLATLDEGVLEDVLQRMEIHVPRVRDAWYSPISLRSALDTALIHCSLVCGVDPLIFARCDYLDTTSIDEERANPEDIVNEDNATLEEIVNKTWTPEDHIIHGMGWMLDCLRVVPDNHPFNQLDIIPRIVKFIDAVKVTPHIREWIERWCVEYDELALLYRLSHSHLTGCEPPISNECVDLSSLFE